jgi:hypothetical protein
MPPLGSKPQKFQTQIAGQQNGLIAITNGLQGGETVVSSGGLFLQFAGSVQ